VKVENFRVPWKQGFQNNFIFMPQQAPWTKIKVKLSLLRPWKHMENWRYGATHKLSPIRR